jgi:hypothetical protein
MKRRSSDEAVEIFSRQREIARLRAEPQASLLDTETHWVAEQKPQPGHILYIPSGTYRLEHIQGNVKAARLMAHPHH